MGLSFSEFVSVAGWVYIVFGVLFILTDIVALHDYKTWPPGLFARERSKVAGRISLHLAAIVVVALTEISMLLSVVMTVVAVLGLWFRFRCRWTVLVLKR